MEIRILGRMDGKQEQEVGFDFQLVQGLGSN